VSTNYNRSIENPKLNPDPASNTEKDPDQWVSGDEPMTGAQASYLKTLSEQLTIPMLSTPRSPRPRRPSVLTP
jgi:Protein of unknown function (DUF3072)